MWCRCVFAAHVVQPATPLALAVDEGPRPLAPVRSRFGEGLHGRFGLVAEGDDEIDGQGTVVAV